MNKGVTLTSIFRAQSLSYGESIGNFSSLKKITVSNGIEYTYAKNQTLTYEVKTACQKRFGWSPLIVDKSNGTVQFMDGITIKESPEMDLFGYMRTKKGSKDSSGGSDTRTAVVRSSNAISLEPYRNNIDFSTNKGLADRIGVFPDISITEQHLSYYVYTITIDLDRVGVDKDIDLPNEEKCNRLLQFLEMIKVLSRTIKGRQENLAPFFVIGGLYEIANPFFLGRVKLKTDKDGYKVSASHIKETVEGTFLGKKIKSSTYIGMSEEEFTNRDEIKDIIGENLLTVDEFFGQLANDIKDHYGVN